MTVAPIAAVGAADLVQPHTLAATPPARGASFSQMLMDGVDRVDRQVSAADAKVAAFAVDDAMPPHEVIFAIQQARQSMELMLQVRSHLVEGFQEVMRMQL